MKVFTHCRLFLLAGVLLICGCVSAWAQRFETVTRSEGLSANGIRALAQDKRGFLWIGTEDGLNRFDGYRALVFKHDRENPHSLSHNYIWDLLVDQRGILWVGTDRGLCRFDVALQRFTRYFHDPARKESLSNDPVLALGEDQAGDIWIGTSNGLNRLGPARDKFERFFAGPETEGLPSNRIYCLRGDREGGMWIGTSKGLSLRTESGFQRIPLVPGKSEERPRSFDFDSDHFLWVSSTDGLFRVDPVTLQAQPFITENTDGEAWGFGDLIIDDRDRVWLASQRGLLRFDPATGKQRLYTHDPTNVHSLPGDLVSSLLLTRDGTLWIGTPNKGLGWLYRRSEAFGHLRHSPLEKDSLSHDWVNAVLPTERELWIGNLAGLDKLNTEGQVVERYRHREGDPGSLAAGKVRTLYLDRRHSLWVGTDNGLNYLRHGETRFGLLTSDRSSRALSHNWVNDIYEDETGILWLATPRGLNRLDPESLALSHEFFDPTRFHNHIWPVIGAGERRLWLGTEMGLMRYHIDQKQFERIEAIPGDIWIYALHQDLQGTLWVGSYGDGLFRYLPDRKEVRHLGKSDGLPDETITNILRDEEGRLWLTTGNGLSCYHPWDESFRNFSVDHGLQDNHFTHLVHARGADGRFYFGGPGGLTYFDPQEITPNRQAPTTVITDFQLFNNSVVPRGRQPESPLPLPIELLDELQLSYEQNMIAFEFAALHYAIPKLNRYAYKLEGLQDDWVYTHAEKRYATFTNLDPGHYTLKVKGSNCDGVWQVRPTELRLLITPPPWASLTAYLIYGVIGLGILAVIVRMVRTNQRKRKREREVIQRLREVDRLKDDFLANTSHELRTPLFGIIGLAESLIEGNEGQLPDQARASLKMIALSGTRLSRLVKDILDFSKIKQGGLQVYPRAVDLHALCDVVLTLSRPLLGNKQLELYNHVDNAFPPVLVDEMRLEQILFNLVSNAIKFTPEGSVRLGAEVEDGMAVIQVSDTGIGIAPTQFERIFDSFEKGEGPYQAGGTGLGLTICKALVDLHGGHITVASQKGEGTTFTFTLPLADAEPTSRQAASPSGGETMVISRHHLEPEPEALVHAVCETAPRIMIVDDEGVNRYVLANFLKNAGYRLTEAQDGEEALALVEKERPDLILLDIMMPRLSGFEVCRRLRLVYPARELPIIFLSALDKDQDLVAGLEAGANDYLTKPVSHGELLARVKIHLELLGSTRELARNAELRNHAARLEELNHLKSQFLANVSHELRTPLTLNMGPLQDILAGALGPLDPRVARQLEVVYRNAGRLLRLIDQLLDLAHLEAGGAKLQAFETDMVGFARARFELFQPLAEHQKIEMVFSAEPDEIRCFFDPDKIDKMLYNLLSNALKFTEPGGRISLELMADNDHVKIEVCDTGVGIFEKDMPHIFDRFYQGQGAGAHGPSTGIGLALVKEFCELHGGVVQAASVAGEGTHFKITLPLGADHLQANQIGQEEEQAPLHWLVPEGSPDLFQSGEWEVLDDTTLVTLLLIEDNLELRAYLADHFKSCYRLLEANNGKDGLRLARKAVPDLIITDVAMPEMDGLSLLCQLRGDLRTSHIPVVLLTARVTHQDRLAGLECGADAYITKPFSARELELTIANLLEARQRTRQQHERSLLVEPSTLSLASSDEAFLRKMMDVIESQMQRVDFGVSELAREMGLSRRQLHRKVTALIDKGPSELIRATRVKRAVQMLTEHVGTVSEIAYAVGFNTPSYFSRVFLKEMGKSPTVFQAEQEKRAREQLES